MDYKMLSELPAEKYLDAGFFRTAFDGMTPKGYAEKQYTKALQISEDMYSKNGYIVINVTSVWGASYKVGNDFGSISSYEGIGYHSNTADLLAGFLAGPAEIRVFRNGNPGYTVIKEAGTRRI